MADRGVEQGLRALARGPGPCVDPGPQVGLRLGELLVLQDLPQLTYMLQAGVLPLAVRLQHRRVADVELLGEVVDDFRRHVGGVVEEHSQIPRGRQL